MPAKAELRRTLDRLDNEEVRQARRMVARARGHGLRVLHLGDSLVEWVAPSERDQRPLWAMLRAQFNDGRDYFSVHGGSYSSELHNAFLHLALEVGRPEVVVVPIWFRGRFLPWMRHPVYGRRRAAAAVAGFTSATPTWRIRRSFPPPTSAEWEQYQALSFETLAGERTIGEFSARLKDTNWRGAEPAEWSKLIYAYHQTHQISDGAAELAAVEDLGRTLRQANCPVVAYENAVSVRTGVELWGTQFADIASANNDKFLNALLAGYGAELTVLRVGADFEPDEFIDPVVADEHLKAPGRIRLTRMIIEQIAAVRPDLLRIDALADPHRLGAPRLEGQ